MTFGIVVKAGVHELLMGDAVSISSSFSSKQPLLDNRLWKVVGTRNNERCKKQQIQTEWQEGSERVRILAELLPRYEAVYCLISGYMQESMLQTIVCLVLSNIRKGILRVAQDQKIVLRTARAGLLAAVCAD